MSEELSRITARIVNAAVRIVQAEDDNRKAALTQDCKRGIEAAKRGSVASAEMRAAVELLTNGGGDRA